MEFEYLIIFLPLVGSIISGFFGKFLGSRNSEILTSLFVSISAIFSFLIFYKVFNESYTNNLNILTWINQTETGFLVLDSKELLKNKYLELIKENLLILIRYYCN